MALSAFPESLGGLEEVLVLSRRSLGHAELPGSNRFTSLSPIPGRSNLTSLGPPERGENNRRQLSPPPQLPSFFDFPEQRNTKWGDGAAVRRGERGKWVDAEGLWLAEETFSGA